MICIGVCIKYIIPFWPLMLRIKLIVKLFLIAVQFNKEFIEPIEYKLLKSNVMESETESKQKISAYIKRPWREVVQLKTHYIL